MAMVRRPRADIDARMIEIDPGQHLVTLHEERG